MNWRTTKPLILLAPCFLFSGLNTHAQCYAHADMVEDSLSATHILRIKINDINTITTVSGNISTEYAFQTVKAFQGEADKGVIVMDGGDNGVFAKITSNFKKLENRQYYVYLQALGNGKYELIKTYANKVTNSAKQDARVSEILERAKCGHSGHCHHDHESAATVEIAMLEEQAEDAQKSDLGTVVPSGVSQSKDTNSGFIELRTNIPTRFVASDGGRSMTYSIDAEFTPAGFSRQSAIDAVHEIIDIWESETNLKFVYKGEQELGKSALDLASSEGTDGHLFIQLHDHYNQMGSSTLGKGGSYMSTNDGVDGSGGTIDGLEFDMRTFGYLSINTDASSNQSLDTFKSVLSHEVGHCLGLAHSSEASNEPNNELKSALMYYSVSNNPSPDLTSYDRGYINLAYPQGETVPYIGYSYGFVISTSSQSPVGNTFPLVLSGVEGGGTSVISVSSPSSSFATLDTVAGTITLVPANYYSTVTLTESQVEGGSSYGRHLYKISNGIHISGLGGFVVMGFYKDTTVGDGIPSDWAAEYGVSESPDADPDGDGFTNEQEYMRGSDPGVADAPIQANFDLNGETVEFTPSSFSETLILEGSNNLTSWQSLFSVGTPSTVFTSLPVNDYKFFRIRSK